MSSAIVITTSQDLEGHRITHYLGIVRGIVVRAPGIGRSFLGSLKRIVGGNIGSYESVCDEARQHAFQRMVDHAAQTGATAVIAIRYDATEFMPGVTEVLCYGTAVRTVPRT